MYSLTRLSREKGALAHDDRLDAVTIAVAYWLSVLDRDAQTGLDELLEEQLEAWLDPDRGVFYIEENPQPPKKGTDIYSGLRINMLNEFS